jgi:SAM-dependent methyltransferase
MTTGDIAGYYDRLGRWNRIFALFGKGGGSETLTVHRALIDPKAGGERTFTRLHDVLIAHLPHTPAPRVLDAGCGLGGTMIELARRLGATCVGLTLSPSQAATANAAAARLGLSERVRAIIQTYDEPPQGPHDLIVAIESLAHSRDPLRSVSRLAATLAPGGALAIVDDMPEPEAEGTADLALGKAGWESPVLWSAADYRHALQAQGLEIIADEDLTPQCRPRSAATLGRILALCRIVYRWSPSRPLRDVMHSHMGGLALERLTTNGLVRYRLFVARRPMLQVS